MGRRPGLTVENLGVERDGRPILSGLSFDVPIGSALIVTGSNGAGKSTLLRAIAGLLPLQSGIVALRPRDATADEPVIEQSHYLGHANGLKLALTAAENLRFAAVWSGRPGIAPSDALTALGLPHVADFPAGILSAGQRRRVALARLLVALRPLWLLDEPTTALDRESEAALTGLIQAHLGEGGMIVAAIHAPLAIAARELRLGRR